MARLRQSRPPGVAGGWPRPPAETCLRARSGFARIQPPTDGSW